MTRIGIFGGAFDPIHYGHLLAAEQARESLKLHEILFVPVGDPPHKGHHLKSTAHHRRSMVELAIAGHDSFVLSDIDLDRPGPHYSVDTVQLIRQQCQLSAESSFLLIGADLLPNFPTWYKATQLINLCRIAVLQRPEYEFNVQELGNMLPGLPDQCDMVTVPELGLSSSHLRQMAKSGRSLRYQTPASVIAYIQKYQLYGNSGPF
ncbi:MAG: nicotinate-nucleotide adenylyltransferase [Chloroflexota bacterium]